MYLGCTIDCSFSGPLVSGIFKTLLFYFDQSYLTLSDRILLDLTANSQNMIVPKICRRQCLIPTETNMIEVKMEKCVFCGSLNAAGRFVVPGAWICSSCITRMEEPMDWNPVGCHA